MATQLTMEKGNILSQMAQYDFRTPLEVTMIFEDDDDTLPITEVKEEIEIKEVECTFISVPEKTETANNDCDSNNINITSKEEFREKTLAQSQDTVNNNDVYLIDDRNEQTKPNEPLIPANETADNQNSAIIDTRLYNDRQATNENNSNINTTELYQQINEKKELTAYVKNLLNMLSEHLILIMQPYYHYYYNNPNRPMSPELTMQLKKLKAHFFDLSYSTVVSLILPQENNELFIKEFIDKTVVDANKVATWKCGRHHVEPFYNEMVDWARCKRARIKALRDQRANTANTINVNRILKEKLANPHQPPNIINTPTVNTPLDTQSNVRRDSDVENTTCIFSCGPPGKEISINITPNTLKEAQNLAKKQGTANKKQRSSNTPYPSSKKSKSPEQTYTENINLTQQNTYAQNSVIHYKPTQRLPPPSYGQTHLLPQDIHSLPQNIQPLPQHGNTLPQSAYTLPHNMHTPLQNMHTLPHNVHSQPQINNNSLNQIQHNIQCMQNYYRNINPFTMTATNNTNLGSYYSQGEQQQVPVITSVTSLNPQLNMVFGRCLICGKATKSKCSKCQKFSYCSYLCQELDTSGQHNVCVPS